MDSRYPLRHSTGTAATAVIIALIFLSLFCACLDVEPEELPPPTSPPVTATSIPTTETVNVTENISSPPPVIVIPSLKQTGLSMEQDFPQAIKTAVSDMIGGKTADSINGYLRWESVRARTSPADTARINEQVRRIDYAMFNTSLQENISVYVGITGEQAKRIRNESVYSEPGYVIGSSDPTVVYHDLSSTGRDKEGYLTMCVIDYRRGSRILFVNASEREFLLPHGILRDVTGEDTYEQLEFSADSIPRYDDIIPTKVRLIYTKEHI